MTDQKKNIMIPHVMGDMMLILGLILFVLLSCVAAWLMHIFLNSRQQKWLSRGLWITLVGAIAVAGLLDEYRAYRKKLEPKPVIMVSGEDAEFFVKLEKAFYETRSYYDTVKKLPPNSDVEIYKKYDNIIGDLTLSVPSMVIANLSKCQLNIQLGGGWIRYFYDRTGPLSSRKMSAETTKEYQDRTEVGYLETYAECVELFKQYRVVEQP